MKNWADLAKTVLASAPSVEVGVVGQGRPLGRHATTASGELLFSLVEAAPACAHLVRAGTRGPDILATAAHVSGVAHAGRVLGTVRLGGRAELLRGPVDEELRTHLDVPEGGLVAKLVPTSITLDWRVEVPGGRSVVDVPPDAYAEARVDALAGWQDEWIADLDALHREDVSRLAASVVPLDRSGVVRPVMADESGLIVREYTTQEHRDIRIPFPRVVQCGCQAVQALTGMLAVTR